MLAYSLTNHGDMRRKLEYSFDLYDVNKTGYLEKNDIKDIVYGMVEILGIHKSLFKVAVEANSLADNSIVFWSTFGY